MPKYILKRVLRSLLTMAIITTILFSLLRLMPIEGYFENFDKLSQTQIDVGLTKLGLKDPLPKQLWNFGKQLLSGDLGTSNRYRKGVSINEIVAEKMPISLQKHALTSQSPGKSSCRWELLGSEAAIDTVLGC